MAIDPVEAIRHQEVETPFVEDLGSVLERLANLAPSTEAPYLTVTMDWRPDGTQPNMRTGRIFFDQRRDELVAELGLEPHTPEHNSLTADLEQIAAYLDGEVDSAVQGLAFVACSAQGLFEALPLGMPLSNRVVVGPTPALRVLAKLAEDEQPFAVLLADQQHATLFIVEQAARQQSVEVEASGYPRKHDQGGWSQRRYQMRAEERIEAFARTVAEETERALREVGVDLLVLAGNEQITTTLRDTLHQSVQERIAGMIRLDVHAGEQEVIEAAMPVVTEAERQRELATVGRIQNGMGPGGGAVAGPVETLTALQAGQVMILVLNDDFAMAGWADYSFPVFGTGEPPAEHPAGGDPANLIQIALEEELVRLALQSDAEIEIVRTAMPITAETDVNEADGDGGFPRTEAAQQLDALGGVGAILRFVLAEDHSTAEL